MLSLQSVSFQLRLLSETIKFGFEFKNELTVSCMASFLLRFNCTLSLFMPI